MVIIQNLGKRYDLKTENSYPCKDARVSPTVVSITISDLERLQSKSRFRNLLLNTKDNKKYALKQ